MNNTNKRQIILSYIILFFLLSSISFFTGCITEQKPIDQNEEVLPSNNTSIIYVPANTFFIKEQNKSYSNVSSALKEINESQTLLIGPGNYSESIFLNKSISIKAANISDRPLFYLPDNKSILITINESYCILDGLILNCTRKANVSNSTTAIHVTSSQNRIINSSVNGFIYGIRIRSFSNGNRIYNSLFQNNKDGLEIVNSLSNKIRNNRFENHSRYAVYLGYNTRYSSITENDFYDNIEAVRLKSCMENTVSDNKLYNDSFGVRECCGAEGKNTINNNLRFSS